MPTKEKIADMTAPTNGRVEVPEVLDESQDMAILVPGGNPELDSLKERLDVLAWLHAETAQQIKEIAVQQILNSPEVQEQLRQKLMEQISNV